MARIKLDKKDTTENLIKVCEARLFSLNEDLKKIKADIKEEEKTLADLNEKLKQEKLSNIGVIAENAGVSIDDLLSALKDGTVLSLIAEPTQNNN